MNRWRPTAKQAIGAAGVNLTTADVRLQLYTTGAAWNPAHDFMADLTAYKAGTAQAVGGRSLAIASDGVTVEWRTTDDELTFTGITAGTPIVAGELFVHTGSDATARLLYWVDSTPSGGSWAFTANGADLVIPLPAVLAQLVG